MRKVYLICGVSGSGKTWVCNQLKEKFHYIPHDEHYNNFTKVILNAALSADKDIITECPFGERIVRQDLEKYNIRVIPHFIVEPPELVAKRYQDRENKPIQKAAFTRASSILQRAQEWNAPYGKSEQILEMLQKDSSD